MSGFIQQFPSQVEAGFAWPTVVSPGEAVEFFVSSNKREVKLEIRRVSGDSSKSPIARRLDVKARNNPKSCSVKAGCSWKSGGSLVLNQDWEPGLYEASFIDSNNTEKHLYFFLKSKTKNKDFVFLYDWATLQAYNFYGGQNFYGHVAEGKLQHYSIKTNSNFKYSLRRPIFPLRMAIKESGHVFTLGQFNKFWGMEVYAELNDFGLKGQVIPNLNNFVEDTQLFDFKTVILTGMQEYLSLNLLRRLRAYVYQGGTLILAGNEFGLRAIDESKSKDSIIYFDHPKKSTFYKSANLLVASDYGPQLDFESLFGVTFEHNRSVEISKNAGNYWFKSGVHERLDNLRAPEILVGHRMLPYAKMFKSGDDWCIDLADVPCSKQEVLGFIEGNLVEGCCEWQIDHSNYYYGKSDFIEDQPPKTFRSPFARLALGKGSIILVPGTDFLRHVNQVLLEKGWLAK